MAQDGHSAVPTARRTWPHAAQSSHCGLSNPISIMSAMRLGCVLSYTLGGPLELFRMGFKARWKLRTRVTNEGGSFRSFEHKTVTLVASPVLPEEAPSCHREPPQQPFESPATVFPPAFQGFSHTDPLFTVRTHLPYPPHTHTHTH